MTQAETKKQRRRIKGIDLDEFPYSTTCEQNELSSVIGVDPNLTSTHLNLCKDHVGGTLNVTNFMVPFVEANLTATNHTLAAANCFGIGWNNANEGRTVTIPTNATVAFPVGTMYALGKNYNQTIDVKGDTGVTLVGYIKNTGTLANSWARQTGAGGGLLLLKVATNTWYLFGYYGQGS